jgi:hypothetical protein
MKIRLPKHFVYWMEGTQDFHDKGDSIDWFLNGTRHKDDTVTVHAPESELEWFAGHLLSSCEGRGCKQDEWDIAAARAARKVLASLPSLPKHPSDHP